MRQEYGCQALGLEPASFLDGFVARERCSKTGIGGSMEGTFGLERESSYLDYRLTEVSASCCGVNLAGGVVFLRV